MGSFGRIGSERAVAAFVFTAAILGATAGKAAAADASGDCSALSNMSISRSKISLPNSGAIVVGATLVSVHNVGNVVVPEYCRVMAKIVPVDPQAEPIQVEINLPTTWNGKALQMGGGGFDGYLVTADGPGPGAAGQPTPLSLGYATFGSDGGHHVSNPFDVDGHVAAFMNDEVLTNYAGAQLKKTHDLALALINLRYGRGPRRTYFVGASGGGRGARTVTQSWGADYDGVISYYPGAGGIPLIAAFGRLSRALVEPGAYPNRAKRMLLHNAVLAACDGDDGAVDGIVSNPRACRFDVASIRCKDGVDAGDTCLSDLEIRALKIMASDLRLEYQLASGETGIAGYRVFQGVDLTLPVSGLGSALPKVAPAFPAQPLHDLFYDLSVRGWIMRNPKADSLDFDAEHPGRYAERMSELSAIMHTSVADLSGFSRHGGKLILVHGDDDALIPVGWSERYYQSVVDKMGSRTVNGFLRFYMVPGYGHGAGAFDVDWDSLSALDRWVEAGVAPVDPVAADANPGNRHRTRPLCAYPAWPRFKGSGNIDMAKNFPCTAR